ncbi:enoyl-CoA hydratase/isomerase family protein [Massilia niabensis]|uniref:Enoyl-CoA hydratase/isomerase family protein n=1 Tax=Massilia niabensis TaxID=544910 RepID=A0ABW0L1R1_9BURK
MNHPAAHLRYTCQDAIARIVFDHPQALNAIDSAMARAFLDACRQIAADPSVRVVLISGEGRAFMAGGDIAQFRDAPDSIAAQLIDPMHEGLALLGKVNAPVIASLHGAVAGAGLSIALACDLSIAADSAKFNFAYTSLGASCDCGASWSLPRLVGLKRSLEIALLPGAIDAAGALGMGLVNRVVPLAQLADATEELAAKLAAGPTLAYGSLKRLMRGSLGRSFGHQLEAERAAFVACSATADFKEAVGAFLGKRGAQFAGR